MKRWMERVLLLLGSLSGGLLLQDGQASAQEVPEPVPPIPLCGARSVALIDDFEAGVSGSWYTVNDQTGVQLPLDLVNLVVGGGPGKSKLAAHTAGEGFVDWGAQLGVSLGCAYDVRKFEGVTFAVKAGGAGAFRFDLLSLPTQSVEAGGECTENCWDHYGYDITLEEDGWYECNLRFKDLTQIGFGTKVALDLRKVNGLQQTFRATEMPFDAWLDDVAFARRVARSGCAPIERERACSKPRRPHGR
jgi:hypothetical protein